jgi:hypothetical protein
MKSLRPIRILFSRATNQEDTVIAKVTVLAVACLAGFTAAAEARGLLDIVSPDYPGYCAETGEAMPYAGQPLSPRVVF